MSSDNLPMETQDDRAPMTDATLTSHGLCRGGSRNIKGQNGMCRLLCLIKDFDMASLDNQYTELLRTNHLLGPPYLIVNE
jgi:hypothetical protein